MLSMMVTWPFVVHVFVMAIISVVLCPNRAIIPFMSGAVVLLLYADFALEGAVSVVFLVGFFVGMFDVVSEV